MPGGEIHLLGVLRGAQKFDVQQSPEVLVEFFTRAYHPPSLMSTLQNAAWAADVPRFSRIPRGAAAPLWKAAAAQRIRQKFARALTPAQNDPERLPMHQDHPTRPSNHPGTRNCAGIFLEALEFYFLRLILSPL